MTSISNDSTLSPRTQRDTRRMNWFVSIAAAVAGLLFGLGYRRDIRSVALYNRPFHLIQPASGVGG